MHLSAMADIWPNFTSRPARALKFSRLSQHGIKPMSMECLLFGGHSRAMFGPYSDHIWLSLISRLATPLKFSRLSQHGLTPMSTEYILFRTILGPC